MLSQPAKAAAAFRATVVGSKIRIVAPASDALQEFLHTLPSCRWDKAELCWKCNATPAAAWRLLYGDVRFHGDEALIALASGIQASALDTLDGPILQPNIRNGDLWRHQLEAYRFARNLPAVMLHMGMGCGKSNTAITIAMNRRASRILIACPKSVMGVWRREFAKHCPIPHEVLVLDKADTAGRNKALTKALARKDAKDPLIVVINYDSVWRSPLFKTLNEQHWDVVICDESQRIKGHSTAASKAMAEIGETADFRMCLSGTPMQNSPMDVFAQFRFLDPGVFGTSYHWFRSRYAVSGHFGADHIVGYRNQDELAARMRLLTFHADRSVLDLPPVQHITVPVELGKETRTLYEQLEREMIAWVEEGGVVTAANALTKTLRLRQITGGFTQLDDGTLKVTGSEKRDALVDLLDGMDQPCVVFCEFVHDLDQIADAAKEAGRTYGELSGRRKDLTEHGQMQDGIDVMAVQVRSGGVGVDLTRAPYAVYWNHPWSPGIYDQSAARVHRPGQEKPVVYYHLSAVGTIDETVWEALQDKQDIIEAVISFMKGVV